MPGTFPYTDDESDSTFETGALIHDNAYLVLATYNGISFPVFRYPTSGFSVPSPVAGFTFMANFTAFTFQPGATFTISSPAVAANTGLTLDEGGTATITALRVPGPTMP